MATLNLVSVSSFQPATSKHLFLPTSVRSQINYFIEHQHVSPLTKAEDVASLLAMTGILPGTEDRFYVGPGNNQVAGYSKFRAALRKLGYNVVTKE